MKSALTRLWTWILTLILALTQALVLKMSLAFFVAFVAPMFPSIIFPSVMAQERLTFGDYEVVCEQDLCTAATTVPVASAKPNFVLAVERLATEETWRLRFSTPTHQADLTRPMSFRIDGGRAVTLYPAGGYAPYGGRGHLYIIEPGLARSLLSDLTAGGLVRFSYLDILGAPHDARFSLKGITAALQKIDDIQNTASASRQLAAPSDLQQVVLETVVDERVAEGVPDFVIAKHMAESQCEDPMSSSLGDIARIIAPVSNTATLYGIPCIAAAYNTLYRFYVLERGEIGGITTQYFADFDDTFGWTGSDVLYNAEWNASTGQLTSLKLSRGVGDCGSSGVWMWQDYALKMMELRAWSVCGNKGKAPEDWPQLFSSSQ